MRPPEAADLVGRARGLVALGRIGGALDAVREGVDWLLERPRTVLATLVVAHWAAVLVLAMTARHNGWLYFQGGDQIWYSTSGWLIGKGVLPLTLVGYGWSLLLVPITWLTGSTYVEAMPAIALLNVAVLGPIAVLAIYGIATRIGGRLLGYWAALLWVFLPYIVIPLFVERYHERYVDQFLPQGVGLTAPADYPSMVALLVAGLFVLRAIDLRSWTDATLAGIAVGFAGGMKPPNYLLAVGAAAAFLVARRWREAGVFGLALIPALLTLAVWKYRGIGTLPLFEAQGLRQTGGAQLVAIESGLGRYVQLDWEHWRQQMAQLREFFWSARLAQWAPIAGTIAVAVALRRRAAAALLAGWLGAFLLVKGFSPLASIETNTFFRLLMPAWPAYLLLFAAIPLLVPTAVRRLGPRLEPPAAHPTSRRTVVIATVVALLAPLLLVVFLSPLRSPEQAVLQNDVGNVILTPVTDALAPRLESRGESSVLTWKRQRWPGDVFYRVYRTAGSESDVQCDTAGVKACTIRMLLLGSTREPRFVDGSPPAGVTYRIAVAANYRDDQSAGDVVAFSAPFGSER